MNPEFDLDGVDWRRILEHHLDPHVILEAVEGATGVSWITRIRWANQAARARPALSGIDLDGTLLSQILDPQLTAAMGAFFATALRDSGSRSSRDVRASVKRRTGRIAFRCLDGAAGRTLPRLRVAGGFA